MLVDLIAGFLGVSILFYCLFAGADFGAGILEAFRGRRLRVEQREVISHAISPVWEANHVWLILALVILFVGFPKSYAALSTTFHIPLTLMLLGVVLRGCAFTFRQYDVIKDRSQTLYSAVFVASSFLTPLMLGILAGGVLRGGLTPTVGEDFYLSYVAPWANPFCLALGFFTCVLFTFLAAVYLIGETADPALKKIFARRALVANALAVLSGALVFISAEVSGFRLVELFARNPSSVLCLILATALLIPLWLSLKLGRAWRPRVFAVLQVALILVGWLSLQYSTLVSSAAPRASLEYLLGALLVGSGLIFPALFYLFRVFKSSST